MMESLSINTNEEVEEQTSKYNINISNAIRQRGKDEIIEKNDSPDEA